MDVRVVLVEPLYEGNVGAVARAMANFGASDLWMVNPCELGDDAFRRSKHARPILESARVVDDLTDALEGCAFIAGTTGIVSPTEKHFVRVPMSARDFASRIGGADGRVALLFGREDIGLYQDELRRCDMLVNIPSSPEYPVLNLSHAVSTVLYELYVLHHDTPWTSEATGVEKERLFDYFAKLLDSLEYPEHRREKTEMMFRRLMGRAVPTKWEFYTLVGILGDAAKRLRDQRS